MAEQRVFIIRGFGEKKDSKGRKINFDTVQSELIDPALKACGLAGGTTGEIKDAGNIRADMFALILEADIVICDITVHNANVFYELGIRHALRKKHTLLLKGDPSADTTPFDLSTDRYLKYPVADPKAALPDLIEKIKVSQASARETDSPIFLMLPDLSEADASEVRLVPLDFIEELERAEAAADKGWLRVIAQDLSGQRFQWEGLRRVALAQWSLKDYEGARDTWNSVRQAYPDDVEACLALANLYERQYRIEKRDALLETSNQMIERVLGNDSATPANRTEALALEGRNLKTLWRQRFASTADAAAALPLAVDIRALQAYEAYRKAFDGDLNAFYPGVAALQMGVILQKLATLPAWRNLFRGDDRVARRRREDLDFELPALEQVVAASVRRARAVDPPDKRIWADIAEADLLFLRLPAQPQEADVQVVLQAYAEAIPTNKRFAWDASGGQLALFGQLDVHGAQVQTIMKAMGPMSAPKDEVEEHLVVFTGHGLDAPGQPPRFPREAELRARQLISDKLNQLKQALPPGRQLTVLASAAPGADILAHELCGELAIASRLCLPIPVDKVAALAFADADGWRSRFRAVADRHEGRTLLLSDQAELPRWVQNRAGIDIWERGNRWVMARALSWGAKRLSLLAFWDGQDDGRSGGTAHMVRMAKAQGNFDLEWVDSRQLLT
jgi:tetratricopeptide (TPR) repeat protein